MAIVLVVLVMVVVVMVVVVEEVWLCQLPYNIN